MCFEHLASEFVFLFDSHVFVTQDNYIQYKPVTKETNRVTSQ